MMGNDAGLFRSTQNRRRGDGASNCALERTAGSPSLAAAAHRRRSATMLGPIAILAMPEEATR